MHSPASTSPPAANTSPAITLRATLASTAPAALTGASFASPEFGNLSIGANFFAMHYANNQNAFTHGMGGYFSPQAYFLANIPFSWTATTDTHWHYNINGALGVQAFQEDSTPLWPLAARQAA